MATERRVSWIISANIENWQKNLNKAASRMDRFGRKMQRAGRSLTRNITVPIGLAAGAAVKASMDFESAFTGVRKTVNATEAEFQHLRKGILDMSKVMPTSAAEIAGVAEAAGQLGIKTSAILEFSETMVKLGDSTNLTADQAATSLARIANIMQLPQDQFDEMGSTIVDLGNNFATTESEITDFAQRISGAGQIAGFVASDIFSIATAMTSVGIEAGLGGTAVQKVLLSINKAVATSSEELHTFAKTAGITANEFKRVWEEDAAEAFAMFVNGLGRQGDMAAETLEELGLADQRLMRAFLSLANAGDLVNRTLETGRKAWEENSALTKEAQQRYDTLASKFEMLRNKIFALGVEIGDTLKPAIEDGIKFVGRLTETFSKMSDDSKTSILKIAGLLAIGGPLLVALGTAGRAFASFANLVRSRFGLITAALVITTAGGKALANAWSEAFGDAERQTLGPLERMKQGFDQTIGKLFDFTAEVSGAADAWEEFQMIFAGTDVDFTLPAETLQGYIDAIDKIVTTTNKATESTKQLATNIESIAPASVFGFMGDRPDFSLPSDTIDSYLNSIDKIILRTKKVKDVSVSSFVAMKGGWESFVEDFQASGQALNDFMVNQVSSAFVSLSESIGMSLAGAGNEFKTGLERIMLLVLDFAKQLGTILIGIGSAIMIIPGLQGPAGLYIAGGSALVALATGVKAGIEKRASNRRERSQSVGDALIRSDGSIVEFHPDDNILAMRDFSNLGMGGGQTIHNNLFLDGQVVWQNQRRVNTNKRR